MLRITGSVASELFRLHDNQEALLIKLSLVLWDRARELAAGNQGMLDTIAMFHTHFVDCLERRSFNDTALPVRQDVKNVFNKLFGLIGMEPVVELLLPSSRLSNKVAHMERSLAGIAGKFGVQISLHFVDID
jgi:hypothetical protein